MALLLVVLFAAAIVGVLIYLYRRHRIESLKKDKQRQDQAKNKVNVPNEPVFVPVNITPKEKLRLEQWNQYSNNRQKETGNVFETNEDYLDPSWV